MIPDHLLLEVIDYMGLSFPLKAPLILVPNSEVEDWGQFQLYLKVLAFINQDGKCICNKELINDGELHHALVSRKDAMKIENPWKIHHSYNVLLLHHHCHTQVTRVRSLGFLSSIFGLEEISVWYNNFSNIRRLEGVTEKGPEKFLF